MIPKQVLSKLKSNTALPNDHWYLIASVTMSALNMPQAIPAIFEHATAFDPTLRSRARTMRRMQEGLIKSSVISGLPRTINALSSLQGAISPGLDQYSQGTSSAGRAQELRSDNIDPVLKRGQEYFNTIYGKISSRIMSQLVACGTEELAVVTELMYGFLLSNEKVLKGAETSSILIASLIPQDVNAQLRGHLEGATHHEDLSRDHVREIRSVTIELCRLAGMRNFANLDRGDWGWRGEISDVAKR